MPETGQATVEKIRAEVEALLKDRGWSKKDAAKRIGINSTTLSQWLHGKHRADNARIEQLVRRWLDTERDISATRTAGLDRHADLAVTEQIERAARHAQANADAVVICGFSGAGKSRGLKDYCKANAGACYVEMSPAVTTPASVLSRIAEQLGVGAGATTAARLERAVVGRLKAGSSLLVADEAHQLNQALLDVIRCVYDQAGCGVVFAGNEPLWSKLTDGDRAAQLVSRVGLTLQLGAPAEADILELAQTLLGMKPTGKARSKLLAVGGGMGGLRAVKKLAAQAFLLAAGDGRDRIEPGDIVDAAELMGTV